MVCVKLCFFNPPKLGFEAAVAAIGMKAKVSEAEHPLLCEGTRSVPNQTISDNFFVCFEALTMELSKLLLLLVVVVGRFSILFFFQDRDILIKEHLYGILK